MSKLFVKALNAQTPAQNTQSVFFGTGIVTQKGLSAHLPFDFLSLIAAAADIRAQRGRHLNIVHYVADETAIQTHVASPEAIMERADDICATTQKLSQLFNLEAHYVLLRGSQIKADPLRQAFMGQAGEYVAAANLPQGAERYVQEQLADMAYLREQHGGGIKLSWTMARNEKGLGKGFDESFFDAHYDACFGSQTDLGIEYTYIQPGRRLDSKANRACPYTALEGEPRMALGTPFARVSALKASGLEESSKTYQEAIGYWDMLGNMLRTHLGLETDAPCATRRIDRLQGFLAKGLKI